MPQNIVPLKSKPKLNWTINHPKALPALRAADRSVATRRLVGNTTGH